MSEGVHSKNILFVSNQGGMKVTELKCKLANDVLGLSPNTRPQFAVLSQREAHYVKTLFPNSLVDSFEEFRACEKSIDYDDEKLRLVRDYPDSNWSKVLFSERSFFDISNLEGGAGERNVSQDYVEKLLIDLVRFFEQVLSTIPDLVVAQTPDSLMTLVLYHVARTRQITLRGLSPAWISPDKNAAGFLVHDEFLHSPRMLRTHNEISSRPLTHQEVDAADSFRNAIGRFDANSVYKNVTGVEFGKSALSPNIRRIFSYLIRNYSLNSDVHYYKIDFRNKFFANIKRFLRKIFGRRFWGTSDPILPNRSVFFPFHFQPEASTLVGGVEYADQAATAEAILRALPFGWSLIIKEHPAGRGTRPLSHYRRLKKYPNVVFCDAPSKTILSQVDAVVTVTGTIGIEAIALDKPVVMLGRWFWDFCPLVYKCQNQTELPLILRKILIDGDYAAKTNRDDQVRRFLIAYLSALVAAPPRAEGANVYASALLEELCFVLATKNE